jgi:prostaglandin-endoperoxide synthase 2
MGQGKRDTSRDGFRNQLEFYLLTHGKWFWKLIQSHGGLKRRVNKALINNAIYKIPTRPYPLSTMAPYTSWDSLTDRTFTGRHLPPDEEFNRDDRLPSLEDATSLFRKRDGQTSYSTKSTLLFPYWVQWFTDGFLRTDRVNRMKNTTNHHIDLSPVYGLNKRSTDMLRAHEGGRLKSQLINGEEYPLYYYEDPERAIVKAEFEGLYQPLEEEQQLTPDKKAKLFAMGVERANVQIGYVMLNVLCLREHNRLCGLLARQYPAWDDERLFQTARNIVILLIMKIVIEEYINHITPYHFKFIADPSAFRNESWYRTNWMTMEFNLVYRWHSALPDTLVYDGRRMPMEESVYHNELLTSRGLGALFDEASRQPATRIGLFNTLDALLYVEAAGIALGRQAKLASYNDYRQLCKFPRVTDFDQITADEHAQRELKRLYGHVDNIEFYVGIFAEQVRENSALPSLIGRLVGIDAFSQALTNPLLSEHVFNERTFSPLGWEVIQNTRTLSDIVQRNIPAGKHHRVSFYLEP